MSARVSVVSSGRLSQLGSAPSTQAARVIFSRVESLSSWTQSLKPKLILVPLLSAALQEDDEEDDGDNDEDDGDKDDDEGQLRRLGSNREDNGEDRVLSGSLQRSKGVVEVVAA